MRLQLALEVRWHSQSPLELACQKVDFVIGSDDDELIGSKLVTSRGTVQNLNISKCDTALDSTEHAVSSDP